MLERVVAAITRYNMFARTARVGVAVSGGADSLCLLHLLSELAPQWDLALTVLHLNHGLRGEESRGDAEFVRQQAQRLGWPVIVHQAILPADGNLEQAAREARIEFFTQRCRVPASIVWLLGIRAPIKRKPSSSAFSAGRVPPVWRESVRRPTAM